MNESPGLLRVRSGELLFTDEVGRDACGIGGVAAKDGKPSAEVLKKTLTALKCMEHRGGVCGDAGDGAGLTVAIPQAFFKEEAKRLRLEGSRFLKPEDITEEKLAKIRKLDALAKKRGQSLAQMSLAWTLRDPRVTSTLIGASSVGQLEDSLGALGKLDFSSDELAEIDRYATDTGINLWARSSSE